VKYFYESVADTVVAKDILLKTGNKIWTDLTTGYSDEVNKNKIATEKEVFPTTGLLKN